VLDGVADGLCADGRLTATVEGADRSVELVADLPGEQVGVLKAGGLINHMRQAP